MSWNLYFDIQSSGVSNTTNAILLAFDSTISIENTVEDIVAFANDEIEFAVSVETSAQYLEQCMD